MRGLICFNYLAGEDLAAGDVVALAFDKVKSYQHVVRRALAIDDPIGVALSSQEQGRAITVAAFVTGQSVNVLTAGNVIKGDQLAIDDNSDIVAFTGGEGQRPLPLMALAASTGAGLIPAVCADCLAESGGGAEFTDPVVMQDDLTVNGDTVLKGLTSSNLHMAAQSKIYFGEKSFGRDDLGAIDLSAVEDITIGGVSYRLPPVGGIARLGLASNSQSYAYFGVEFEPDGDRWLVQAARSDQSAATYLPSGCGIKFKMLETCIKTSVTQNALMVRTA